jgi:hypothetical protein
MLKIAVIAVYTAIVKEPAEPRSRDFGCLHDYRFLAQVVKTHQCDWMQLTDSVSLIRVGPIVLNSALGGLEYRPLTL